MFKMASHKTISIVQASSENKLLASWDLAVICYVNFGRIFMHLTHFLKTLIMCQTLLWVTGIDQ